MDISRKNIFELKEMFTGATSRWTPECSVQCYDKRCGYCRFCGVSRRCSDGPGGKWKARLEMTLQTWLTLKHNLQA